MDTIKCTRCSQETDNAQILVDLDKDKTEAICFHCFAASLSFSPEGKEGVAALEKLDADIEEAESIVKSFTSSAQKHAAAIEAIKDDPIMKYAFLPQKGAMMSETMLAGYQKEHQKILDALPEVDKLNYLLQKAVSKEEYEEAARLKMRLDEIESGRPKEDI